MLPGKQARSHMHSRGCCPEGSWCGVVMNGRPREVACNFWRHLQSNPVVSATRDRGARCSCTMDSPVCTDKPKTFVGVTLCGHPETSPFAQTSPLPTNPVRNLSQSLLLGMEKVSMPFEALTDEVVHSLFAHTSPWSLRRGLHAALRHITSPKVTYHSPQANITPPCGISRHRR